jgi:hypothetical protein
MRKLGIDGEDDGVDEESVGESGPSFVFQHH